MVRPCGLVAMVVVGAGPPFGWRRPGVRGVWCGSEFVAYLSRLTCLLIVVDRMRVVISLIG